MNKSKQSIPYWIAIIINVNIVVGSTFFLSAQDISVKSGLLGPALWLGCGLLLFPLIAVFAKFAKVFPEEGGIYVYSERVLGSTWGFLSCWGYFIGTAAGNAAVLHAFGLYVQKIPFLEPTLQSIGLVGLKLDLVCALFFMSLNLLNVEFLEVVQVLFTVMKTIPMALVVVGMFFVDALPAFTIVPEQLTGSFAMIPMVLFAYIGVEACCAVGDQIKQDDGKSSSSVIWVSFAIIVFIYSFLQFAVYLGQGSADVNPFLTTLSRIVSNSTVLSIGNGIVYFAMLCSFLAGFYGAFYFNSWNLHAMAEKGVLPGSHRLKRLNKNNIPYIAVLSQAAMVILMLLMTSRIHYLFTMSDFGVIIAYLCTALAFVVKYKNITGILALFSCTLFMIVSSISLVQSGIYNLVPFLIILCLGVGGYKFQQYVNDNKSITSL